jgi:predicted nucleic acid-binding protein
MSIADRFIAATAAVREKKVVTSNLKDFPSSKTYVPDSG